MRRGVGTRGGGSGTGGAGRGSSQPAFDDRPVGRAETKARVVRDEFKGGGGVVAAKSLDKVFSTARSNGVLSLGERGVPALAYPHCLGLPQRSERPLTLPILHAGLKEVPAKVYALLDPSSIGPDEKW
jgi:hypothetical protein